MITKSYRLLRTRFAARETPQHRKLCKLEILHRSAASCANAGLL
jgi:hypothetical protein